MVGSTARDLPDHRKEVTDACLRQGMFPMMMEHLPASDAEAISASLMMVDKADIYVGVFAYRYGYVPKENNPRKISITEMEYDYAVKRNIPRLIFVMDKAHLITIDDIEQGAGAHKLKAFKERLQTENVVNFFKSPADLRAHIIHSLSQIPKDRAEPHMVKLLERLSQVRSHQSPRYNHSDDQGAMLHQLALEYKLNGQPGHAAQLQRTANIIAEEIKRTDNLRIGLGELSDTARLLGALYESDSAARKALIISREVNDRYVEAISLHWLGLTLAARGLAEEAESALQRALRIYTVLSNSESEVLGNSFESLVNSFLAQRTLWLGKFETALSFADRAWELARMQNLAGALTRAARRQGQAALGLNDVPKADERLHHALTRARIVNLIEEELPALIGLAELRRRQGDLKAAHRFLDDVWQAAERGPYLLLQADACNALAQIEYDAGNAAAAIEAAMRAYRLAWCDGPPFAYHWELEAARRHLRTLGASEPELPSFDLGKCEPTPEVEIDINDEFHAGRIPNS